MIKNLSVSDWKDFLSDRGVSQEYIDIYLPYVKKLIKNDVPIIFEFEHLSNILGIKESDLAKMVNSPNKYYREFNIPKRSGGVRTINSPYPSLLECQKWIYKNILLKSKVHECAHGFIPQKSIITNASQHLGQKCLLKMDFENFFPSIPINWVINYFNDLGYAKNISFYLGALCCLGEKLSQGSITSPYLSNILLFRLDERLYKLATSYNLQYTRYADDITFSGNYIPFSFINIITEICNSYKLKINTNKTRLYLEKGKRIVTGLSVAGDVLRLPKDTKRNLRKEIFYIRKYGFVSHISKMKINNPSYLDSLEGKLVFWLQVEPDNSFAQESLHYIKEIRQI